MTIARRNLLVVNDNANHAGLLLTRYLKSHKPSDAAARNQLEQTPEEELLNLAMKVQSSNAYSSAYKRWRGQFLDGRYLEAELASSLAIGLGNESPLEVGLTVSHTYGMPLIPGSAIKGMCRRGALKLMQEGNLSQAQFFALFGLSKEDNISEDQHCKLLGVGKENGQKESAGCITFHDAWYDPNSVEGRPFHRDVITVHHQDYYGGRGSVAPTDFDDPTPVPFLVVKPKAKFFFAIEAPDNGWAVFTIELLKWSLANFGIGGKTNAGYGYFNTGAERAAGAYPAGAGQAAPSGALESQTETWENVTVRLNPGSGELSAQFQQQRANVTGSQAQILRAKLPQEKMDELRSRRQLQANIKVEVAGNRFTIVEITPL